VQHPADDSLDELRRQMRDLEAMEAAVAASPDRQISLTDPDARAMASSFRVRVWSATTFRQQSTPAVTWSSRTRSSSLPKTARRWQTWRAGHARQLFNHDMRSELEKQGGGWLMPVLLWTTTAWSPSTSRGRPAQRPGGRVRGIGSVNRS
jgi:hypothetical protein